MRLDSAPAGSAIFIAPDDLHRVRNAGDIQASYFVIRLIPEATPLPVARPS